MTNNKSKHLKIIRDSKDNFLDEYNIKIHRLTPYINSPEFCKKNLGAAIDVLLPGESIQQHKHPVVEMIYLANGTALIAVEAEKHIINSGDVSVMLPNKHHQIYNTSSETIRIISFWWEDTTLKA